MRNYTDTTLGRYVNVFDPTLKKWFRYFYSWAEVEGYEISK